MPLVESFTVGYLFLCCWAAVQSFVTNSVVLGNDPWGQIPAGQQFSIPKQNYPSLSLENIHPKDIHFFSPNNKRDCISWPSTNSNSALSWGCIVTFPLIPTMDNGYLFNGAVPLYCSSLTMYIYASASIRKVNWSLSFTVITNSGDNPLLYPYERLKQVQESPHHLVF